MAVEVLVALAAVLAAALAVRWARHHGPLRPRGAPPIFEGAPLVGGLLKFAKVSSFEAHWSHRWRDIAPLSWLAPEADRIVARRRRGGFILSRSATIFSQATSLAVATHLFLSVCPYILLPFWPFWSLLDCQQKQGARTDPLAWLDWESNAGKSSRCALKTDRSFFFSTSTNDRRSTATKERRCPCRRRSTFSTLSSLPLSFLLPPPRDSHFPPSP